MNRATLARQLLLERQAMPLHAAVHHLVALQAQLARPPYLALWSRLAGFKREDLLAALMDRSIVRATFFRGTLFYLTAEDYLADRTAVQPVLDVGLQAILTQRGPVPPLEAIVALAHQRFGEAPCPFETVRQLLLERHPGMDERAMGYAARMSLPLVQVPNGSTWGFPGTPDFTTAKAWLGKEPRAKVDLPALVRRYLVAFGPASPKDMQVYTGLKDLKQVFEGMELVRVGSLYDVPGAPLPDEDTPAPVRFLPDFDCVLSAYDKRQRIIADEHRKQVYKTANLRVEATYLEDGFVAGTWKIKATKTKAVLEVTPFSGKLSEAAKAEGEALLRFAEPEVKSYSVVTAP